MKRTIILLALIAMLSACTPKPDTSYVGMCKPGWLVKLDKNAVIVDNPSGGEFGLTPATYPSQGATNIWSTTHAVRGICFDTVDGRSAGFYLYGMTLEEYNEMFP